MVAILFQQFRVACLDLCTETVCLLSDCHMVSYASSIYAFLCLHLVLLIGWPHQYLFGMFVACFQFVFHFVLYHVLYPVFNYVC